MYEIRVRMSFSAAHNLKGYRGKRERLHGHNWTVEAAVSAERLNRQGLAMDFTILKKALKDILERLDHSNLNEHPYFKKANPSSENIAKFIYDRLKAKLTAHGLQLTAVTVWESENCCATYREG